MPKAAQSKSVREAKQAMYRDLLVEAAERVFAESGYEGAKMQAIASQAGVSLATVYRLYPGKWDLFRAVHDRRGRELMDNAMQRIAAMRGATALDVILDGVAGYVTYMAERVDYLRMHLREGGAWSTGGNLRSQEQVDLWNGGLSLVARMFEQAIRAGEMVDDDPPELMARTMIAMHQVRLADWVDGGMTTSPQTIGRAVQRQLLRAFCPPDVAANKLAAWDAAHEPKEQD